eukprot:gene2676-12432_t
MGVCVDAVRRLIGFSVDRFQKIRTWSALPGADGAKD